MVNVFELNSNPLSTIKVPRVSWFIPNVGLVSHWLSPPLFLGEVAFTGTPEHSVREISPETESLLSVAIKFCSPNSQERFSYTPIKSEY